MRRPGARRAVRLALGAGFAAAVLQIGTVPASGSPLRLSGEVGTLYPGVTRQMRVEVSNQGARPVLLRWLQATARAGTSACPATYLVGGERRVRRAIPPGQTVAVAVALRLRASAPDDCQGVRFGLRLRARASGPPSPSAGGGAGGEGGADRGGGGHEELPGEAAPEPEARADAAGAGGSEPAREAAGPPSASSHPDLAGPAGGAGPASGAPLLGASPTGAEEGHGWGGWTWLALGAALLLLLAFAALRRRRDEEEAAG